MNELLLKTLETVISHFWIITLTLILSSVLKKILYVWIEFKKLEVQHKDIIRVSVSENQEMIEIHSSKLKIDDLQKLKQENLLSYKKAS